MRPRGLPLARHTVLLLGVGLFVLATVLYTGTMATSFVPGDSANYLNLANTGGLNDRGNGLPLYITVLNAAVHLPLPFELSDGYRCNLLTVLMAVAVVVLCFTMSFRATGSAAAALAAAVTVMVSGLVWDSSTRIMPHVTLALIGVVFLDVLLREETRHSRASILTVGLACGLGFGLMPNALLFLPGAALLIWVGEAAASRSRRLTWLGLGTLAGILVNVVLIAVHETLVPTIAREGTSVPAAIWFYLHGGHETSWLLDNVTLGHRLRTGLKRLLLMLVMLISLLIMIGAFTLIFCWLLLRRLQCEIAEREIGTRWLTSQLTEGRP